MNNHIYLQLISLNKNQNQHFLIRYVKMVSFFKQRNFKKVKGLHHEHHIIPESFGGPDTNENLIVITIREHFILHHLLYKAFPKSSMVTAFNMMCHCWGKDFRISSKVYANAMLEFIERQRETTRKSANKRVANGTHNLLGSENNNKRVANGTHNFLGGEVSRKINKKRLEDGTHHFLDKEKASQRAKKLVAEGKNNFQGGEVSRKRVKDGTHPLLGKNQIQVECEHCKKIVHKGNYNQWHGDKCKFNPLFKEEPKILCEHCNKEFFSGPFKSYHGDKCKLNPLYKDESTPKPKIECPHCNRYFYKSNFIQHHGDKCKLKPQI